ncbi:MAG: cytosolic protein [Chloroflexi bacterium]|nr:cytosolic protein [Chloroflexota bacterium]
MSEIQAEFDSAWKEAIERYFEPFMAFFFPNAHAAIDWDRKYEFLDTELQQVARDAALGRRLADKLVKVWRRDGGDETWVIVHIEVQGQVEPGFAERMYVYNYRLYDRHRHPVASLAVLGDERANWRPDRFTYSLFDCQIGFVYPVVKLVDYADRWEYLAASDNIFAVVVLAHLKTLETRGDADARRRWKFNLVRGLYDRGLGRDEIAELFRVIDWLMALPDELEQSFWNDLREYEEERKMPYITSVERIGYRRGLEEGIQEGLQQGIQQGLQQGIQQGLQQGIQQGLQQGVQQGLQQGVQQGLQQGVQQGVQQGLRLGLLDGIALGLELKFGTDGLRLLPAISKIDDPDVLKAIHEALKVANTLDELRRVYESDS